MIEAEAFSVPQRPQMLAQPPYSFDLSVMYWAPTLALGGTLFALPKELTTDFQRLFMTINQLPIGVWTSTPSFVDMAMLSNDFNHETLPNLTHFYFDGEELTVKTAQKLRSRFPKARIVNAYGPTEATVALSAVAITDEMLATCKRLPIGYTKADSPTLSSMKMAILCQMENKAKSSCPVQLFLKVTSTIQNARKLLSSNSMVCQPITQVT